MVYDPIAEIIARRKKEEQAAAESTRIEDKAGGSTSFLGGIATAVGSVPSGLVDTVPETIARSIRGGEGIEEDNSLNSYINRQVSESESKKDLTPEQRLETWATIPFTDIDITHGDLEDFGDTLGYSMANMVVSLGTGAAVTAGVTAATGGAGLIPGIAAGGSAGVAFSQRASKDEFVERMYDDFLASSGGDELDDEQKKKWELVRDELNSDANWYGLYEALPETFGSLLMGGIAKVPLKALALKPIKNALVKRVTSMGIKLGAMYGEELTTEGVTAMKQSEIEAKRGLRDESLSFGEAVKEVAPMVALLTPAMGGGAHAINKTVSALKKASTKTDAVDTPEGDAVDAPSATSAPVEDVQDFNTIITDDKFAEDAPQDIQTPTTEPAIGSSGNPTKVPDVATSPSNMSAGMTDDQAKSQKQKELDKARAKAFDKKNRQTEINNERAQIQMAQKQAQIQAESVKKQAAEARVKHAQVNRQNFFSDIASESGLLDKLASVIEPVDQSTESLDVKPIDPAMLKTWSGPMSKIHETLSILRENEAAQEPAPIQIKHLEPLKKQLHALSQVSKSGIFTQNADYRLKGMNEGLQSLATERINDLIKLREAEVMKKAQSLGSTTGPASTVNKPVQEAEVQKRTASEKALKDKLQSQAAKPAVVKTEKAKAETVKAPVRPAKRAEVADPNRRFPFNTEEVGEFKDVEPSNYGQVESVKDSIISRSEQNADLTPTRKASIKLQAQNWARDMHKRGQESKLKPKPIQKESVRFSKTKEPTTTKGTSVADIKTAIDPIQTSAKGALGFTVVENQDKLPKAVREKLKADGTKGFIKAIRHGNKIYMVANNIKNTEEAVKIWLHEQVGHHGLMKIFDEKNADFGMFIKSVTKLLKKDPVFAEVAAEYSEELKDLSPKEQNAYIIEEILARRAEKLSPTKRKLVYQKFKEFLNKWLKKLFGEGGDFLNDFEITNKDINTLLQTARNRVIEGDTRAFGEFVKTHKEYKDIAKEVLSVNPGALSWYENHQEMLSNIFGKDADLINVLFGITSAQTDVQANAAFAVDTYLYMLGKVDKVGGIYPSQVETKVNAILEGNARQVGGGQHKIPEFIRALLGDENATVNDRWMRRIWFGDVMLSPATASSNDKADARESNFSKAEHAASRHELFKLAKELTEETDHTWTPREVQAALWMEKASTSKGIAITEQFDYRDAMNAPISKYNGLTPVEYLRSKATEAEIGSMHKEIGGITFSPVSRLEKEYVQYLKKNGIKQIDKYSTDAKIGMGVHYSKADIKKGNFIIASKNQKDIASYSVSDVGNRMYANTEKNPYAELVYFYEGGAKPETQVKSGATQVYNVDFKNSKIYDMVNDAMDISGQAAKRLKKDPGANIDNIRSNLIESMGYDGYVVTAPTGGGRWIAMFKRAAVTYPAIEADIGISDVIQGLEDLSQDIDELSKDVRARSMKFEAFVDSKLKNYPEIEKVRFNPAIASFNDATFNTAEISGALRVRGPLGSIRAMTAEIAIERSQKQVYVMHTAAKPNGMMHKFKVKKDIKNPSDVKNLALKHGLTDLNNVISLSTGNLFVEQYLWTDQGLIDSFKAFRKEAADQYWPRNEVYPVTSEIHGFQPQEGEVLTPNEEAELALVEFKKDLVKYYGEQRAEKVFQASVDKRSDYRSELTTGVKRGTGNSGSTSTKDNIDKDGKLKFSKTKRPTFSDNDQGTLDRIGKPADPATDRIDKFKESTLDWIIRMGADSLHAIKKLESVQGLKDAGLSGYRSFRMLSNFPAIMGRFLHDGALKWDADGRWAYVEREKDKAGNSLGGLYSVVKDLGDGADLFFRRMMANSAQEMVAKGRTDLFGAEADGTPIDDTRAIALLHAETAQAYGKNKQAWDDAAERLRVLNDSVLDLAKNSHLINEKDMKDWKRHNYIPFYRVMEDIDTGDIDTLFPKAGVRIGSIEKLEGSKTKNVGDPLSNLVNSYSFMINQSLKNLARTKTLDVAKQAGLLEQVKTGGGKTTIDIRIQGKTRYYKVEDPAIYDALLEMDTASRGMLSDTLGKIFTAPKRWLTAGVTFAPAFRVANIIRDTIHTGFMAKSFTPILDSGKGLYHAWTNSDEFVEYASTGGAFSGAYHERDIINNTSKEIAGLKKRLKKGESSKFNPIKLWQKIGEASENAARMGLYLNERKEGKSRFEAGFDAKDLLDFHMSGKSSLIKFLIQTVPFMNARIQGLYKLGRTATEAGPNRAGFYTAATIMMVAASALHFANDDEEWYKDLKDHERIGYFNVQVPGMGLVRIPSPFEVGSFFGVAPTAMYDWAKGHKDGEQVASFLGTILLDTFAFNPTPQIMKPLIHQWGNKDSFTGVPIITRSEDNLDPMQQYNARTSKLSRAIAQGVDKLALPDSVKEMIGSPKRIDKFASDLVSFYALAGIQLTDMLFESVGQYPVDPATQIGDRYISGIGRFFKGSVEPRHIQDEERFYDMVIGADKAYSTYRDLKTLRDPQRARDYKEDRQGRLKTRKPLSRAQKAVGRINAKIKLIQLSTKLSDVQKQEQLQVQLIKRNALIKKTVAKYYDKFKGRE